MDDFPNFLLPTLTPNSIKVALSIFYLLEIRKIYSFFAFSLMLNKTTTEQDSLRAGLTHRSWSANDAMKEWHWNKTKK